MQLSGKFRLAPSPSDFWYSTYIFLESGAGLVIRTVLPELLKYQYCMFNQVYSQSVYIVRTRQQAAAHTEHSNDTPLWAVHTS